MTMRPSFIFAFLFRCRAVGACSLPDLQAEGVTDISCDGINYTVAVPAGCTADTPCGLLWDIHGGGMSATAQNAHTNLRVSGPEAGHIVMQPTAPVRSDYALMEGPRSFWKPNEDYAKLEAVLRQAASAAEVDASRVHVTGFSQGGFTTWSLLCRASDIICSVAPIAASGLDAWDSEWGFAQTCFGEPSSIWSGAQPRDGPATARPILYATGVTDEIAIIANAHTQKQYVLDAYGMAEDDASTLQPQGAEYEWLRWTADGVTFEYLEHNFNGVSFSYGSQYAWLRSTHHTYGHCIPRGQADDCGVVLLDNATFMMNEGCCASIVWSDLVLEFFARHPCPAGAGGDDGADDGGAVESLTTTARVQASTSSADDGDLASFAEVSAGTVSSCHDTRPRVAASFLIVQALRAFFGLV